MTISLPATLPPAGAAPKVCLALPPIFFCGWLAKTACDSRSSGLPRSLGPAWTIVLRCVGVGRRSLRADGVLFDAPFEPPFSANDFSGKDLLSGAMPLPMNYCLLRMPPSLGIGTYLGLKLRRCPLASIDRLVAIFLMKCWLFLDVGILSSIDFLALDCSFIFFVLVWVPYLVN